MGYSRPQPVPASRTVGYHLLEAASTARATAGSSSSVAVAEAEVAELATEAAIAAAVDELARASRSQMAGATAAVEVHVDASDS